MTQSNLSSKVIPATCGMCYIGCGIKVQVDDGVVVNIEGNPDNPQNRGMMCAKGKAGFMNLYNPNRVKTPLKRTNPKKGMDEDPGWVEISWAEAIDTIVAQLERIRNDPKKLWIYCWEPTGDPHFWVKIFGSAFGTPHTNHAASPTCGKVVHPVEYFSGGGFHQAPDVHYANYCILVGTQFGVAARGAFNHNLLDMADARERGMKLVVIDPVGGHAASKANEWIPIRPGTDAALANSMLHVLLNELGICDVPFLKNKTNAPYLIGADGRYVRHPQSNEPQVHDLSDGRVKAHNDPDLKDPALKGAFDAQGRPCRPAFELLCEHVAKYSPEATEKITTIPAATVRRIAREFGEAARIGETITIDGVEMPFRPAAVDWAKGTQGHKHGFHNCWPLKLLNIVIGSVNVPGGILSTAAAGKLPFEWGPEGGTDGLLEDGGHMFHAPHPKAYPGRIPSLPKKMDVSELFPLATHCHPLLPVTREHPAEWGLDYGLEVLLHTPSNSILSSFGDVKKVEQLFQSLKFMAGFAVEINETTVFDDIVLPYPTYLERYDFNSGSAQHNLNACGKHDFHWQLRHPVVEPPPGVRQSHEVLIEIADRLGILADFYRLINHTYVTKDEYALKPGKRYTSAEVVDRQAKSWFGEDRGVDWFAANGVITLPRDIGESYIGPGLKARLPVYLEHLLLKGEQLKGVLDKMGLAWDLSDYRPLSDWMPCPSFGALQKGEFDLIAVHFKLPYVYGAFGNENPWIDELCEETGAYRILLNESVGRARGIGNGDSVWLESPARKVRAVVKLTQCVHPEVVGVGGHFGHWSKDMPVSRGKGVSFNSLVPTDLDRIDLISTALDHCVEVKVYK